MLTDVIKRARLCRDALFDEPVVCENSKIEKINKTVMIEIAGIVWRTHTRVSRASVGPHVDPCAMAMRLSPGKDARIPRINTGTGSSIYDP